MNKSPDCVCCAGGLWTRDLSISKILVTLKALETIAFYSAFNNNNNNTFALY